jgi:hypothetical protein
MVIPEYAVEGHEEEQEYVEEVKFKGVKILAVYEKTL